MSRSLALVVALLMPGGLLLGAVLYVRRRALERREDERADLVPRWKAFMERPASGDEPTIAPAAVPPVRPLKARRDTPFELLIGNNPWRKVS